MSNIRHFAKIFAIITISLTTTAVDCYEYERDEVLTLKNNSDKTIGWYIPTYQEFLEGTLPDEIPGTLLRSTYHILPGESHTFIRASIPDEYRPDDLLKLYIFNIETLYEYSWETVVQNEMYEHCFELDAKNVKSKGNIISYPEK